MIKLNGKVVTGFGSENTLEMALSLSSRKISPFESNVIYCAFLKVQIPVCKGSTCIIALLTFLSSLEQSQLPVKLCGEPQIRCNPMHNRTK